MLLTAGINKSRLRGEKTGPVKGGSYQQKHHDRTAGISTPITEFWGALQGTHSYRFLFSLFLLLAPSNSVIGVEIPAASFVVENDPINRFSNTIRCLGISLDGLS